MNPVLTGISYTMTCAMYRAGRREKSSDLNINEITVSTVRQLTVNFTDTKGVYKPENRYKGTRGEYVNYKPGSSPEI